MIVEPALGATLGVAAIPHGNVHGKDGRCCSTSSKWMANEQSPQSLGVYLPSIQRGVEAAPAATMQRLEAQVSGGRGGTVCGEDGVRELEEGVFPAVEAFVERAAEGAKSIGRFHDAPIMRSPRAFRILCRQHS
jgi:hypothetical protein